ncbi:hypothetical protein A2W15_01455 [Candidatus Woesebacteria bacterium RBG_16_41_13]|nr:MAG: hypothetical protein A2W15_01455 [Candidatus Woesebacteria bacterium RBG_16_41_13]
MSDKKKLLNCYQDLQRATVSLYQNPKGETHKIFLDHAQAILDDIGDSRVKIIQKIKTKLAYSSDKKKIADEILTTGILLKP